MKKYNIFNPIYFSVFVIVAVLAYYFLVPVQAKNYFIQNTAMGKWLMPSRNSLKKALNIIHLPYWFRSSNLPAYYINISPGNQEELIANLPFDSDTLYYGTMYDEYKHYVNADFISPGDDYGAEIKIRYRGGSQNHWNAEKKSLRIKFPKDNLFSGMRGLALIIPDDRAYFTAMLNAYRVKKLGLLGREFKLARVFVNGSDQGVYLAVEPWSNEFLVKNGVTDTNNIFSTKDKDWREDKTSSFRKNKIADWQSYTAENDGPFEELYALFALTEDVDDEEFARKIGNLLDLEKFYRWQLLYTLAGSSHVTAHQNLIILFRQETGKFELLPFDIGIGSLNAFSFNRILVKRILANEKFLKEYQKVVSDYTSDEDNLKDDLAYYDGLYQKYFYEFYKDQAKLDPDYVFDRKVEEIRSLFIAHFNNARELTAKLLPSDFVLEGMSYSRGGLALMGSFKYFNDIFMNVNQFLAQNTQFYKINDNTIALSAGTHAFSGVTVVPQGLSLVIEPGAQLLFAPGASLISYSPVVAVGTDSNPIAMRPQSVDQPPWGSFGVINTGVAKNRFSNISVSGGAGGGVINGVPFISQFSLHGAEAEIYGSNFENSRSDDALHAVGGSVDIVGSRFLNNYADGIDFDFVKNAKIAGNFFFNRSSELNGDGIDLSGARNLEISGNKIMNFGDKCVSVGEDSQAVDTKDNILVDCNIGMAVKDNSHAFIGGNIFLSQRQSDLELYRKKQEFIKGGTAEISDSIFWNDDGKIKLDEFSFATVKNSIKKSNLSDISLPAYITQYLNLRL